MSEEFSCKGPCIQKIKKWVVGTLGMIVRGGGAVEKHTDYVKFSYHPPASSEKFLSLIPLMVC